MTELSYHDMYMELEKETKYITAQNDVYKAYNNKGERDEILLKLKVFNFNELKQYSLLVDIFGNEADQGVDILDTITDEIITDINNLIVKATQRLKADCKIKMKKTGVIYCITIKSKNGADPSFLNHTPRTAKIFKPGGELYEILPSLDIIAKEYNYKRTNNSIGEDVSIDTLECIKDDNIRNAFNKLLLYFIFMGTGTGFSNCAANAVIYYKDEQIIFTRCRNEEEKLIYVKSINLNRLTLSFRDKQMPKYICDYCRPWVFEQHKKNGEVKYKGSIHIRIK